MCPSIKDKLFFILNVSHGMLKKSSSAPAVCISNGLILLGSKYLFVNLIKLPIFSLKKKIHIISTHTKCHKFNIQ